MSADQTALVRGAAKARNADFTQQIIDLCNLRSADNPDLDLNNLTNDLRNRAVTAFAEPSLVGMTVGGTEEELLRAYQQAADEVVIKHGDDPLGFQFLEGVQTEINTQRGVMQRYGVEPADTQYWHFTPRVRDLARAGLLKSGAHPEIANFTGSHSEGVHFVRPGPGNPRNGWVMIGEVMPIIPIRYEAVNLYQKPWEQRSFCHLHGLPSRHLFGMNTGLLIMYNSLLQMT